jgi:hypothetical protein
MTLEEKSILRPFQSGIKYLFELLQTNKCCDDLAKFNNPIIVGTFKRRVEDWHHLLVGCGKQGLGVKYDKITLKMAHAY